MNKDKTAKLIVLVLLLFGIAAAAFLLLREEPQPVSDSTRPISDAQKAARFSCHYQDGANHARCLDKSKESAGCYGYYDLKGNNIVDGINIESGTSRAATCEGFTVRDNLFFDGNGNLVK